MELDYVGGFAPDSAVGVEQDFFYSPMLGPLVGDANIGTQGASDSIDFLAPGGTTTTTRSYVVENMLGRVLADEVAATDPVVFEASASFTLRGTDDVLDFTGARGTVSVSPVVIYRYAEAATPTPVVPSPAALPAGLLLLGFVARRRRRPA